MQRRPYFCPRCHAEDLLHPCEQWKVEIRKESTPFKKKDEEKYWNLPKICSQCGRIAPRKNGLLIAPADKDYVLDQQFFCNTCR